MPSVTRSIAAFVAVWCTPLTAYAATPELEFGYGPVLLRTVLVLGGVCLLAWVLLRWVLRRFQPSTDQDAPMAVVARLPIEPRRTLLLVRVGRRRLLLASSEAGLQHVADLTVDDAQESSFSRTLEALEDVSRETSAPGEPREAA